MVSIGAAILILAAGQATGSAAVARRAGRSASITARTTAVAASTATANPTPTTTTTTTTAPTTTTTTATTTATTTTTAATTATATAATPPPPPPPTPTPTPTTELTLEEALELLDRQNLSLAEARARAEEAAALSDQARAPLLPTVTALGTYVRNSDAAAFVRTQPLSSVVIQPLEAFTGTGAVRIPLVVPSAWFEAKAARRAARAADASAEATRLQLRAGFAQAAHAARAAEEVVVASEAALDAAAAHARSAGRRVAAGTSAPLDSLKAQTEQVRRESDLAGARAELARARLALGVLLGRGEPVRVVVPEAARGAEPAPSGAPASGAAGPPLVDEALDRRPELRATRAQVEAAEAQVRAGWARLAPQLSATGSAFASDVPFPTGEKDGWRAGLELGWTLFDGGLREGRRRQAGAQLDQARAAAEAQRLEVVQEVSDGARDVRVAEERLRLAETQRRLASDAAESARRSFEAGVASSLDVIDANDRLFQADVGLADARSRLAQARISLARAVGRG